MVPVLLLLQYKGVHHAEPDVDDRGPGRGEGGGAGSRRQDGEMMRVRNEEDSERRKGVIEGEIEEGMEDEMGR